jgi:hypothetical protein
MRGCVHVHLHEKNTVLTNCPSHPCSSTVVAVVDVVDVAAAGGVLYRHLNVNLEDQKIRMTL